MLNYYNTGTVSVNNGATTVTLSGGLWSSVLAGDTLELAGQRVTIASVTDTTHVVLANAWSGTTQSGATYLIRFDAPSRFTSGYLAEQVRALVARAGALEAARPNYEVQSLGSNAPPGSPVTGDMYVVGTAPTGAWAGRANNLAQWTGSAWLFTAPERGTTVVSAATGIVSIWNGTAWTTFQTALGFTPVNKAGDTMTGSLGLRSIGATDPWSLEASGVIAMDTNAFITLSGHGLLILTRAGSAYTAEVGVFLLSAKTVTMISGNTSVWTVNSDSGSQTCILWHATNNFYYIRNRRALITYYHGIFIKGGYTFA